jgi:N utilization substance protein A
LKGVGPKTVEKLEAAGITSIEKLADMTPEQLVEIPGIGEKMVEKIHQSVQAHFEALEAQESGVAVEAAGPAAEAIVEESPEQAAGEAGPIEETTETEGSIETGASGGDESAAEGMGETETAGDGTGEATRNESESVEGPGTEPAGETAPEDEKI